MFLSIKVLSVFQEISFSGYDLEMSHVEYWSMVDYFRDVFTRYLVYW